MRRIRQLIPIAWIAAAILVAKAVIVTVAPEIFFYASSLRIMITLVCASLCCAVAIVAAAHIRALSRETALRLASEKSAQTHYRQLQAFIRHMPKPVALLDNQLRYLAYSEAWPRTYLPTAPQNLQGKEHFEQLSLSPESLVAQQSAFGLALAGVVQANDNDVWTTTTGQRFRVAWELRPWHDEAGNVGGVICYSRDIAREKQVEDELRAARTAAEAASQAKTDFLANISHEIRTPMTAMLGYTELLTEDSADPQFRHEMIQTIRRNGEHLMVIINDILDLAKLGAGKMTIEPRSTCVASIINDVGSLLSLQMAGKGLEYKCMIDPSLPSNFHTDPTRLRQILLNLLGNAVKFTRAGSITITAKWVGPRSSLGKLRLSVADTGIGMSLAQQSQIFKPFAQADGSMSRRFGGTGLGLAICRQLAELMHGEITVITAEGKGSTFTLLISPMEAPGQCPVQWTSNEPNLDPSLTKDPQALSGIRILYAEDSLDNQRLIGAHVRRAGANLTIVGDGRQAFAAAVDAIESDQPYDLILMDMQMPEIDGYVTSQLLRQAGLETPIIALTAHAATGDRERCIAAGCSDYLSKPVSRDLLIATCHSWIKPAPMASTRAIAPRKAA